MKIDNNINYTINNKLCTGCGVCEDVCPMHCISIRLVDGEYRPILDEKKCMGEKCGRCQKVCPGIGVKLSAIAKELFQGDEIKEDKYIGRYVSLQTGFSLDHEIRYHSASGGMVSQILIYLLEKKIVDGAVVTAYGKDNLTPISYIARTKEEILAARSSKYCPVTLNKIGDEIKKNEGKYVIVGVPCHIEGFRKRMAIDRKLNERIWGLFAIYCSSCRIFYAQDYLLNYYQIERDSVSYFAFRDNGCLGSLVIETGKERREVPYSRYYGPMLRSFFKPHRCLMCIDHYGELADVSFGDIHIKPYSDDKIGISSWIIRKKYWKKIFEKAAADGYIRMDEVDADTLNRSQKTMLYPKKRWARAVMNMDRIIGRDNPRYDKKLDKPRVGDYISMIVCFIQQFIGRRKSLWFIIKFLNRK